MVKDIDWKKKLKNKKCQLCGRQHLCDERVSFYVGGFVTYAHPCCLKIYARGCDAGFSGGVVLDPFFGSGTTGLVALKQNKRFIGIELNPEYIQIAKKRLKPYLEQSTLKLEEVHENAKS